MTNLSLEQLEFVVGGRNQDSSPDAATAQLKQHSNHRDMSNSTPANKPSEKWSQK
jgi:hypothetical protein